MIGVKNKKEEGIIFNKYLQAKWQFIISITGWEHLKAREIKYIALIAVRW